MMIKYLKMFELSFENNFSDFFIIILVISIFVVLYSYYYLSYDFSFYFYIVVLVVFIISMCVLVNAENFLVLFLGWDGLGISSYFLVSFYFNVRASSSAMTTVMANRVGDCCFFVWLMSFLYSDYSFSFFLILIMLVVGFTKSAQFPFTSWLPLAMAAPTPISSLVHSSTLVTAGIFMLIYFGVVNWFTLTVFFLVSVMSLFQSGFLSMTESDLKKVVAFSTLNQISLILLSLSLNLLSLGYMHMVVHAVFKSLLFLCVGVYIHNSFCSQSNFKYFPFFGLVCCSFSFMSLLSLFFCSGMYSKDFMIGFLYNSSISSLTYYVVMLSFIFTFFYSFRFMKSLYFCSGMSVYSQKMSIWLVAPLFGLSMISIMMGRLMFSYSIFSFFSFISFILSFFIMMIWSSNLQFKYFPSLDLTVFSLAKSKEFLFGSMSMFEGYWLESMNSTLLYYMTSGSYKQGYFILFFFAFFFAFFLIF